LKAHPTSLFIFAFLYNEMFRRRRKRSGGGGGYEGIESSQL
jgi:hypothetical protein